MKSFVESANTLYVQVREKSNLLIRSIHSAVVCSGRCNKLFNTICSQCPCQWSPVIMDCLRYLWLSMIHCTDLPIKTLIDVSVDMFFDEQCRDEFLLFL